MSKVLVCNNNNKILENIKTLLDEQKVKYDLANSYDVMFDLAEKQQKKTGAYPVIIVDLNAGKTSGEDAVDELASKYANSTVIAMYSYSDNSTDWLNSQSRKNDNVLFLKKPFEDIELTQLVKNHLKKKTPVLVVEENGDVCDFSTPTKRLLDNISHEIRTPLASIVGIAELLQNTRLSDEQNRHVGSILKCSDSLLNIISDMIDFERVQDQDITINSADFNFTDLVEGCVNLVARQAVEKDIDVNLAIHENVPTFIHSDEAKLRKLIWNIVTNAVKYTNYGNVSVFCNYEKGEEHNMLSIMVRDTGIGIDEKSVKNLFNKFGDSQKLYRSGGSGIGLSMTKKILDAFNGTVAVESKVDYGTTFVINIPVATVYDKSLQLQFGSFTPLNEKKGLFISTNELTADAVTAQFAKQNCHLEYAENIRSARNIIQHSEDQLHWCLVDDTLAIQENIPLLKNLVLSCQQNGIKMLLTAKTQSSINVMHSAGISKYIMKPCSEREIRKILTYHSDTARDSKFAPSLIPMDKIKKNKTLKILIAEDNDINQLVLSDMVKRNGHTPEIARHGKIAVDKMAMNHYDLVFMDLQMPILDGIEASKKVRLNDKKTPIIAMTANVSETLRQECELAGINDFLTKPISEKTLLKMVEKYA